MRRYFYGQLVKSHRGGAAKDIASLCANRKKAKQERIKKGLPLRNKMRPAHDINEWILEGIEESRINDHE